MSEEEYEEEKKQEDIDSELKDSASEDSNDGPRKHGEILVEQLKEGEEIYDSSNRSIWVSSLTAGLEIGFSYLLLCTLYSFLFGKIAEDTIFKLMTFVYPVGFTMCILGRSILFTEQTSLLSLPVLNNKRSFGSLMKLWGVVIAGNLVGGYIMASLLTWIGPKLHIFDKNAIVAIAHHTLNYDDVTILISAVLAGWLMGLLSWLLSSAKDSISRIFLVFMVTGVMAFTGLHHSIVGNVEVFSGLLVSKDIIFGDYLIFQLLALAGNALGGFFFVALLKYRAFIYNVQTR